MGSNGLKIFFRRPNRNNRKEKINGRNNPKMAYITENSKRRNNFRRNNIKTARG